MGELAALQGGEVGGRELALLDLVRVRVRVRVWVGVRVRVRMDENSPFLTWWGLG